MELLRRLVRDEKGQGLTEYAMILVLVALAVLVVLGEVGDNLVTLFENIRDSLASLF